MSEQGKVTVDLNQLAILIENAFVQDDRAVSADMALSALVSVAEQVPQLEATNLRLTRELDAAKESGRFFMELWDIADNIENDVVAGLFKERAALRHSVATLRAVMETVNVFGAQIDPDTDDDALCLDLLVGDVRRIRGAFAAVAAPAEEMK